MTFVELPETGQCGALAAIMSLAEVKKMHQKFRQCLIKKDSPIYAYPRKNLIKPYKGSNIVINTMRLNLLNCFFKSETLSENVSKPLDIPKFKDLILKRNSDDIKMLESEEKIELDRFLKKIQLTEFTPQYENLDTRFRDELLYIHSMYIKPPSIRCKILFRNKMIDFTSTTNTEQLEII